MVERKRNGLPFTECFSQNLPISVAFTAILKIKFPHCNAIGVHTPPGTVFPAKKGTKRHTMHLVSVSMCYPRHLDGIPKKVTF